MARIPCHVCGNTFGSNFALNRHNQTIHENQRNFRCDTCDEFFARPVHLENHVRRHHQNIEISCNFCQETFANVENRNRHVQSVHDGRNNFKCVSCDKNFRHLSDLKR